MRPRAEQHVYRPEHSTTTQLTDLVDHLAINVNRGEQMAAIFLDMAKAFNRVWLEGPIHKLIQTSTPLRERANLRLKSLNQY